MIGSDVKNEKRLNILNRQYIANNQVLIVTVPDNQESVSISVPYGTWTDFYTGQEYLGGTAKIQKPTSSDTVILVRENSLVVDDTGDICEIRVYALRDGIRLDADIYDVSPRFKLNVSIKRLGRTIHIASDGAKPYAVRMVNMCAKSAAGGLLVIEGNDSVITPDIGTLTMEVTF